jgi:hypothetical protein
VVEVALLEVVAHGRDVRAAAAERPRLAREGEPAAVEPVVERLHPEAVARAEERPLLAVPDRERPHPVELVDAALAPLAVAREQHLRVGLAAEAIALRAQLLAQLEVVVDLAVEDQLEPSIVGGERLESRVGEVDDREPQVSEADAVVREDAAAVGAAVREPVEHRVDLRARRGRAQLDDPAEAAHQCPSR